MNVSFNTINSNNGAGVNHPAVLRGIYLNTATSANATIGNNTITVKSGATTSQLSPIENVSGSTAASNTIAIKNNLITGCAYPGATSGVFYGIYNNGASPAYLVITGNTFSANSTAATSGSYYNIYNNGSYAVTATYSSNAVTNVSLTAASTSAVFRGIYTSSGGGSATLSVISNTLQNISYSGTASGECSFIYNNATVGFINFSNNIINTLSIPNTGSSYFMYNSQSTNNYLVSGNSITGSYAKTGSGGTFYGYYNFGGPGAGTATLTNNNFSNITLTGSTTFYGFYHATSTSQDAIIMTNTLSNITGGSSTLYGIYYSYGASNNNISSNIIRNISSASLIYGIYISGVSSTSLTVSNNTINTISTSAANSVYGYYQTSGTTTSFFKNKIYDLSGSNASSVVNGIYISSGTTTNIYNNLLGDLRTPAGNAANNLVAVNIAGGTTINMYYNTVRIAATSSGATFGSSALLASTGPNLYLRNNIFINNSTAVGTGSTVAYRRSSTTLTTYSITSDKNLFYAGTPGANNLIFYDGTNAIQTLTAYKAFVAPMDAASITENTPFLSVTGASPSFLHVDPTGGSLTESAASNIPGITDDHDGDIRQGNIGYTGSGTAPDIGADEYNSILPNCNIVTSPTVSPSSALACAGQTVAMNASGFTTGAGIVYQWQVANTPGGPYTNVTGGMGANSTSYATATLATGTYYYIMLTTCTISAQSAASNEVTVTINPYPSLTVTPNTGTICIPGGSSVTLNASGATTYTWLPAAGLNTTVGAVVNALPGGTTIYTVTGASFGCSGTATAMINVGSTPTISGISASPTLVCSAGNSSLQVFASLTSTYTVSNITYSPIPTPSAGVTVLCNNGSTLVAPSNVLFGPLDDAGWANLSIPFPFNMYGTTYTVFGINTNGFIYLGSGFPVLNGYGYTFPTVNAANPCVGAVYSDLNFSSQGSISTFTAGAAPNRMLVVNWTNGAYFSNSGTVTTQAILYETSNYIEVHTFLATGYNTASEVIQNAGGTLATAVPGRNSSYWVVSTPDAYRWSPSVLSYSWSPATYLNNVNISNPVANTVTSNITYTATAYSQLGCGTSTTISLATDVNPTVSITGTNALCSGNTVSLTANGAVNYTWSNGPQTPGITDSPSLTTTYSVIGTSSAGCVGTAAQTVTVYITPTVSIAGNNTVCAGQPVMLTASGANSYTWDIGAMTATIAPTPTANTSYSAAGTSTDGCVSAPAMITITLVALPTVTITPAPSAVCIGQTATLIASGTGVDTYSWSNGSNSAIIAVSPSVTSSYTITVGSNLTGCTNDAVYNLTVNPVPNVTITGTNVICPGTILNLAASGANTYLWSNGATTSGIAVSPTVNSTYTVTGTSAAGCTATAVQSVTVNPALNMVVSASTPSICQGASSSANLFANGASTYSWNTGATTNSITVSPSVTTIYTVVGTSTLTGCSDTKTISLQVIICTGLANNAIQVNNLLLYPNPNNGEFTIELANGLTKSYEINDVTGRLLMNGSSDSDRIAVNLNEYARGVYYVKIKCENAVKVIRVIKD